MYEYSQSYKRELALLYKHLENISDKNDTCIEMVLNDLSNYHLRNY